jgi:DNA-binding transcriptional MocR family regulator
MAELIAFNRGVPPLESFPKEELVISARNAILNEGDQILQYGGAMGYLPLREWVAEKFCTQPDQVIVGQGSLQLLDTFIKTSIQTGEHVFIEQPVYDRVLTLFNRGGVNLNGFMLRSGSMDLGEIESVLKKGVVPKAFYVIPDFQNPSGAEMPLEIREGLVELANVYGFLLIEDGAYRHLRYKGEDLPRLVDLDPQHVLHMSSFSKMISPGIRVGYMVGRKDLISTLAGYAENTYINASFINQAIISDFIQRGLMEDHVDFLKSLYRPKWEKILAVLEKYMGGLGDWIEPKGGFFTGVFLKGQKRLPDTQTLQDHGLMLMGGRGFFNEGGDNFIRLPFAAPSLDQIDWGVRILSQLI